MIRIALVHNHYSKKHLIEVMGEMEKLGTPTIRAMHFEGDLYLAIEGCHRLRAAAALGITPEIDIIDCDTLRSDVEGLDYEDGREHDPEAIVGEIGDQDNITLIFDID